MNTELDAFAGIKEAMEEKKRENEYKSSFDFEKYGIAKADQEYVSKREQIIFSNAKNYSESLYNICKSLYEIKTVFRTKDTDEESGTFAEWYKCAGLNKDKVSEFLKRYELYMLAPDKALYISGLSIPAIKYLTRKQLDTELREKVLELELKKVEDMEEIISEEAKPTDTKSQLPKKVNNHIVKTYKFYKKRISTATSLTELVKEKQNINELIKSLKELQDEIEQKEKAKENENNLDLFDEKLPSGLYKDEIGYYYILPKEDKFALCFTTDKKDFFEKVVGNHIEYGTFKEAETAMSSLIASFEKTAYIDDRGWVFFVRSGIGGNNFKAFYAKNIEDYKAGYRCHAVKSLQWRNSMKDAKVDLDAYAKSKKMKVLKDEEN
ncbi:hypothetical protein [Fusobacterium ulcerans]|uniref:hypothetical protein n=1 Tax=Fusobacterium ulcerans TaxID=861 RepID=UPI00241E3AE4|nr:hypothetical protein [Fusobacterium ulcerans]